MTGRAEVAEGSAAGRCLYALAGPWLRRLFELNRVQKCWRAFKFCGDLVPQKGQSQEMLFGLAVGRSNGEFTAIGRVLFTLARGPWHGRSLRVFL